MRRWFVAVLLIGGGLFVFYLSIFVYQPFDASKRGTFPFYQQRGQPVGGPQVRAANRDEAMEQAAITILAVPLIAAGVGLIVTSRWRIVLGVTAGALVGAYFLFLPLSAWFDDGTSFAFDPAFTVFLPLIVLTVIAVGSRVPWDSIR